MEMPEIWDRVWYVLAGGGFAPALVTRVHDENTVNLTVFGDPSDGPEFATGSTSKTQVRRYVKKPEDEYPTVGMWFKPVGQFAPR